MYKKKKIIGIIPARGGSKGLTGKNIKPLAGKPLIAWTIDAARRSRYLDRLIVSTDDPQIAAVARKYGAEVPFLRPAGLSGDKATSIDVMLHALDHCAAEGENYDYMIMLEPTSPLREASDIDGSIRRLADNKAGAVSIVGISRVEAAHPVFDVTLGKQGLIKPYVGDFRRAGRRQDLDELYFFEGTVYVADVKELYRRRGYYHDRTLGYVVPKWKSLEVDDLTDFICIEAILRNKKKIKESVKR